MPIPEISKVCVLGAGTMGLQIALLCTSHGYKATIYDISEEALKKAPAFLNMISEAFIQNGVMKREDTEESLNRISFTQNPEEAARGANLLSESVAEIVEVKREIHARFDKLLPAHAIQTTNTSSLLVSDIEDVVERGEKFSSLHFHSGMGSLVDIMRGPRTSDKTVDILRRFTRSIGEVPMVMKKEKAGYLYNSMLISIINTALYLVINGYANPEDIDRAYMLVTKQTSGPFGWIDGVGINVAYDICGKEADNSSFTPEQGRKFLQPHIDKGELGIKTGKGFYTYPNPVYQQPDFLTGKDD